MKEKIIQYLENHKSVKRPVLLAYLRDSGFTLTDREMRAEINQMVVSGGFCIRSSNSGYSIVRDPLELEEAIRYIKAKAFPLFERANALHNNFYKDKKGQLTLDNFFEQKVA